MSGETRRIGVCGIIGGTGLYQLEGLDVIEERQVDTPYGKPSAPVMLGRLGATDVAFLPRHGRHHDILPSEINYRANIWALKACGARRLLSVSATGSLAQEIAPGELALASQYLDWTRGKRANTFFGEGLVAHISTAEPACPALSARLVRSAASLSLKLHTGKTYACVDGPRLGTRAESFFLRSAGAHLVGMTNLPEAFLAREAQLCYCTIAIPTDYDCWQEDPAEHVTADKVMALYMKTLSKVRSLLAQFLGDETAFGECGCRSSLNGAIVTSPERLSRERAEMLDFLKV